MSPELQWAVFHLLAADVVIGALLGAVASYLCLVRGGFDS